MGTNGGRSTEPFKSLNTAIQSLAADTRLISIAREGRLLRSGTSGSFRIELSAIDETLLFLVEKTLEVGRSISFAYPVPVADVGVFLAAELLIDRFVTGHKSYAVGLLTGDPVGANRCWNELRISAPTVRASIAEAIPAIRALPDGGCPVRRLSVPFLLIGQVAVEWPVDLLVVTHMAGYVRTDDTVPMIHIFGDPIDPELGAMDERDELIWGWSEHEVAEICSEMDNGPAKLPEPFSVSRERLAALSSPRQTTIHVTGSETLEDCAIRVRDDLRALAKSAGPDPPHPMKRGLRVAWSHFSTLTSLPVAPDQFDKFAGLPPIAARATRTFSKELSAWADTLTGDPREFASVLASDLDELRAMLQDENPLLHEILGLGDAPERTLLVVRTQTASKAFEDYMAHNGREPSGRRFSTCTLRNLHREGVWDRVVFVGTPAPWEWHRIDSGISPDSHLLVLGQHDADLSRAMLAKLTSSRAEWGSIERKLDTWASLFPNLPLGIDRHQIRRDQLVLGHEIEVVNAKHIPARSEPLAPLETLLDYTPLMVEANATTERIGQELEDGSWTGSIEAVKVEVDVGVIFLPLDHTVEIRDGDEIIDCRVDRIQPGMYLLIGRRERRVGLLDAIADQLASRRPDILAADLLVRDLRRRVLSAFAAGSLTKEALFDRLKKLGYSKTFAAARTYVEIDGPMAPRDFEDLNRLVKVLSIQMSPTRIRETFQGVKRLRAFRRAAGRALAEAARGSVIAKDATRVDPVTGLSVADLRDVVLEAEVIDVSGCSVLVPVAELGELQVLS